MLSHTISLRRVLLPSTLLLSSILIAPPCHSQDSASTEMPQQETIGFDRVQPILRKRCQNCHNTEELRGDLSVADLSAISAGSSSGPVVVAGKPRESLLYTTAAHLDEPTMPPNSRKIPARELEIIRRWIEDGLVKKSGDKPADPQMKEENSEAIESASSGSEIPEQNSPDFEPVKSLLQPTALAAVAVDQSGKAIAFSGDKQIVLLDSDTNSFTQAITFPEQDITQLTFSGDGRKLYAGGGSAGLSGSVYAFEMQSGKQLFKIADENDSILALDVSPDGQFVALGGPSKLLKVFDTSNSAVVHTMRKHTDWVMTTKFSPDGLLLASADRFGGIFIWEAQSGELFHALGGHTGAVYSLAWDLDGETLLSAGEDGEIRVWNMHHGTLTAQWDAGVGAILSLDRAPSATLVAGRDGLVKAWRGPDDCIATYNAKEQLDHVVLAGDAKCVVTDSAGGIHILAMPNLEPTKLLHMPVHAEAREELFVRLEKKSAQFEAELEERKRIAKQAAQAREAKMASADNASQKRITPGDIVRQAVLGGRTGREKSKLSLLRSAIKAEISATAETLSNQVAQREEIQTRLAKLRALLDAKSKRVATTRQQLERLTNMLELANDVPEPQVDESTGRTK